MTKNIKLIIICNEKKSVVKKVQINNMYVLPAAEDKDV